MHRTPVTLCRSIRNVSGGESVLFVAEAVSAVLIGFFAKRLKLALAIFTLLYVLHAIPAALGWYGALSEWDDVPYWIGGFFLDAFLVAAGVGARRVVQRGTDSRDRTGWR